MACCADVVSNSLLQNQARWWYLLFLVEVEDDHTELSAELSLFVLLVLSQCLGFGEFNRVPHRLALCFRAHIQVSFGSCCGRVVSPVTRG